MDKADRLRQFGVRATLIIGILWGFGLLFMLQFAIGSEDPLWQTSPAILNCLTILPACTLAFWKRRVAVIWLLINALTIGIATPFVIRDVQDTIDIVSNSIFSICLGLLLAYMEFRGWPNAMNKKHIEKL
jgi:hypothetical protein